MESEFDIWFDFSFVLVISWPGNTYQPCPSGATSLEQLITAQGDKHTYWQTHTHMPFQARKIWDIPEEHSGLQRAVAVSERAENLLRVKSAFLQPAQTASTHQLTVTNLRGRLGRASYKVQRQTSVIYY